MSDPLGLIEEDDPLGLMKTPPPPKSPGFVQRLKSDVMQRAENVKQAYEPTPTEISSQTPWNKSLAESLMRAPYRALRLVGQSAGLVGDVGKEALTSITPKSWQDTLTEAAQHGITTTPRGPEFAQGVANALTTARKKYPEAMNAAEDVTNIAALLAGSKLTGEKAISSPKMPSRIAQLNTAKNTEIANLAKKWSIPTTLGEDIGNTTLQKTETLLEKVPVLGIRKFREKQLLAADDAAKDFLGRYVANPADPNFWGNKEYVDSLYDTVRDAASKIDIKTKALNTTNTTGELLNRYPTIFNAIQDTKTKKILTDIVTDVGQGGGGSIKNPATFSDLWELRKGIGAAKETARSQGNMEAVGIFGKVNAAVDKDIENIAKTAGSSISQDLKVANDAYKTYNVKYQILQRAYDKAIGKSSAGEIFSPKTFSTELKKRVYENVEIKKNQLFKPDEIEEMTGLANIMQTVKRAGQYAENPPTGNRAVDLMLSGSFGYGVFAHPQATAVAATTAGTLRFLTTTETGKNLAKFAAKLKPDSAALKSIAIRAMMEGESLAPITAVSSLENQK